MFTGIVEEIGKVLSVKHSKNSGIILIESKRCVIDSKKGDSISVNGVCLTVVKIDNNSLSFDVSYETLNSSNLKILKNSSFVNLERALKTDSRFGGHFVTGHIDCAGYIKSKRELADFVEFEIEINKQFEAYLAEKGSIAVDGISLTINNVKDNRFSVCIIPHTLSQTCLKYKGLGSSVNIETDILAKYVAVFLQKHRKLPNNITSDFLKENGFY